MVCINGVKYDNIIVASVRGEWKTPCLVHEELAVNVDHCHEDHVGFVIEW